jgi:dinuclear metal center YbgI/SA1388 family protein
VTTVADVLAAVDRLAPLALAESWDNVGLLLGDGAWRVRRVLVTLDVGEAVVEEARRLKADLLLSHHPLIFKDIDRLTGETRLGRLALPLLAEKRAVIAAHTNLDGAAGGLCEIVGRWAGLEEMEPLQAEPSGRLYKVVVFTPAAAAEAVRGAAFAAGAGHIGLYAECSFAAEGAGTFLPGPGTHCAAGQDGRRNAMSELRLEIPVPEARLGGVLAAIGRAHPYETPAIDVYPLRAGPSAAGMGRVGRLARPMAAGALARKVKRALGLKNIVLAGDPRRRVERAAVVTGSGSGLVERILAGGCQAFITGELPLHQTQELAAAGIAVILGGHYATERAPLEKWAPRLAAEVPGIDVRMSRRESDPHGTQ